VTLVRYASPVSGEEFFYRNYKEPFAWTDGHHVPDGVVAFDAEHKVVCSFCGRTFDNLAGHVKKAHGLSIREYKEDRGLLMKTALISERWRQTLINVGMKVVAEGKANPPQKRPRPAAKNWRQTPEAENKQGRCYQQILVVATAIARQHRGHISTRLLEEKGIYRYAVKRYFGGYADLAKIVGGYITQGGPIAYSNEEMVAVLKHLGEQLEKTPTQSDIRRYGAMSATAFKKHFGSWPAALLAAGFTPRKAA